MALDLQLAYAFMVLLGFALVLLVRPASAYSSRERHQYYRLQAITLVGAILGAKLAVVMGDALWPLQPFHGWAELALSGRSIVGALLFGFIAAEVAKPLLNYTLPPNDRFAVVLPFSIATGRLGCWISGCCLGVEMHGPLAMTAADGVSRFPAALVELGFHLAAGATLLMLWRRKRFAGRLFALYLMAYGAFRFGSEFWRVTPKAFAGLSAYQWMCLAMVAAGAASFHLRRRPSAPDETNATASRA
ncbi:MAG TPA: prolipoprotein diacylglyceryl transferase [Arenimonas sp.]|nr:prolipoprotein diacylglyceryl transferase [Arenimonas sp.]